MSIQFQGIGSGLDVDGIVGKLMAIERQPLDALARKETGYKAQLSAYGTLKGALSSLQTAAAALADPARFGAARATVADPTQFGASAATGAGSGTYSVEVKQLAQAQKLKSGSFSASTDVLGSGQLTLEFGTWSGGSFTLNPDKATKTITIAPGQQSLAGVRDAINAANAGVQAGIVNDGSGLRLVLSSSDSGTANALRLSVDDDDGGDADASGLSQLAAMTETVAAQDSKVVIDGMTIVKPSNSITDAIEGVTLTLAKAAPGSPTTLTVARDVDAIKAAVDAFVKAYNDAAKSVKSLSAYDAATKTAATLQGDPTLVSLQSRVRAVLSGAVAFAGGYATLSDLGIAFQKDGTLAADGAKLRAALADTSRSAASAFAAVGTPTDSLVRFASAADSAAAGNYALQVTQLATRGAAAGSAPAALTINAGVNDTLDLSVDGVAQSVTLPAGTYTAASLAALLQSRISGVEATESAGVLTLTSSSWGASSTVSITGGSAAADLFGAPASTGGVNAAGSIGGVAATGAGQTLTAQGLTLSVAGGAPGARGSVTFSRGAADLLDTLIGGFLASDGLLAARTDGINASLRSLGTQRETLNARLDAAERRYRAQFVALDNMMASMNSTSTYLSQQLANLPKIGG